MALLRRSTLLARCDVCRLPFDPVFGGVCAQCGRLLCPTHMYGSALYKAASYLGIRKPCVDCRSKNEGKSGAPQ